MVLRVVYRSYGGENHKGRPDYYSKRTCLLSLLRAAEGVAAELVFVNDGPVPDDLLALMSTAGEVEELPRVGTQESYLTALRRATSGAWADEDVVWFSEDDFLYRPDALRRLVECAAAVPDADYFALYGDDPDTHELHPDTPPFEPRGWQDHGPWHVDGQRWAHGQSTTATFGGRVGNLRQDLGIFRFCTVPHRKMFRDHDTHLLYQGCEPYRYRDLLRSVVPSGAVRGRTWLREAVMLPFRLATNVRAHRRPDRRRVLVTATPNLASHLEIPFVAPGTDWAQVARDTEDWAASRGLAPSAV